MCTYTYIYTHKCTYTYVSYIYLVPRPYSSSQSANLFHLIPLISLLPLPFSQMLEHVENPEVQESKDPSTSRAPIPSSPDFNASRNFSRAETKAERVAKIEEMGVAINVRKPNPSKALRDGFTLEVGVIINIII